VALSGDAHGYASALATLEQTRWAANDVALAANGGNLMKRIRRLLYPLEAPRTLLSPVLSAVIVTITVALALTAWQTKAQDTPAAANTPYQHWLNEDVAYIIADDERAAFKRLETDAERKEFIRQFWLRRDPTPGTEENEFKEEHYRRIAYANDHFDDSKLPGWKTDRGRIYIIYGPPNEIESHPSGGTYNRPAGEGGGQVTTYPFEQWRYRVIEGVGTNVIIEFVDVDRTGEYRMTKDPNEKVAPN
jgi:GWxTD domain-containing protein